MIMQMFIFQSITKIAIIVSCIIVFGRTKRLFDISLQKGLKYFSNAFFAFSFAFMANYAVSIKQFAAPDSLPWLLPILFVITVFGVAIGGFYLAYSLVWRRFEKDRMKKPHPARRAGIYIAALAIALIELWLLLQYETRSRYLLYGIMIPLLGTTMIYSCMRKCRTKKIDPFLSSVSLGLVVYLALFIGDVFTPILSTVFFYVWGIVTVFFVAVAHNVSRV